jgi:hypothetical protein
MAVISFGSCSMNLMIFSRTGLDRTSRYSDTPDRNSGSDEAMTVFLSAMAGHPAR